MTDQSRELIIENQFKLSGENQEYDLPEIPDVDQVIAEAEKATQNCCLMHGSHVQYVPVAGQTVKNIRRTYRSIFNIPEGARALIRGEEVPEEQVLLPGQTLEFFKESGVKGCSFVTGWRMYGTPKEFKI